MTWLAKARQAPGEVRGEVCLPYRGLRAGEGGRATCRAPGGVRLQTQAGDRPMKETITSFVGLDVHKESIAVAVAQAGRQAPRFIGTIVPRLPSLYKVLRELGRASRTLVVYEAGPCGYGLARRLNADGYSCEVVAPARIARSPIDQRIKTDRRDALLLERELRAGNLVPVVIP